MKKMKKPEKLFRTLLIAAMGVALTGVTLGTAFATYGAQIKIEHVWQDNGNTTQGTDDKGNPVETWDPTQNAALSTPAPTPSSDPDENGGEGDSQTPGEGDSQTPGEGGGSGEDDKQEEERKNLVDELKHTITNGQNIVLRPGGNEYDEDGWIISSGSSYESGQEIGGEVLDKLGNSIADQVQDQLTALDKLQNMIDPVDSPLYNASLSDVADPESESYQDAYNLWCLNQQDDAFKNLSDEEKSAKFAEQVKAYSDYMDREEQYSEIADEVKDAVLKQLTDLFGVDDETGNKQLDLSLTNDQMDPDFLKYLNRALNGESGKTLESVLTEIFNNPGKYLKPSGSENPGTGDGSSQPDESFDQVKEDVKSVLNEELKFKDTTLSKETIGNLADEVARAIAAGANSTADNVKDLGLQLDKVTVVNTQTTGWYDKIHIGQQTSILDTAENDAMLKENGYETSLKITIVVVQGKLDDEGGLAKDVYDRPWQDSEDKTESTYISLDDGKTWKLVGKKDKNGNEVVLTDAEKVTTSDPVGKTGLVSEYLYTYLHVRTPDPVSPSDPPASESVPVTPPPSESVPVTPPPSTSVPPSEFPIDDPETPLDEPEIPLDEVELPLEEIPLTGDISYLWYAVALISAAGLLFLVYRNKETA